MFDLMMAFRSYTAAHGVAGVKDASEHWLEFYSFLKAAPTMFTWIQANKRSVTPPNPADGG
jgi:hypothetical protein